MSRRAGGATGAVAGTGSSDERAVSTVLDVALFLLLVSAAVGVLYAVPEPDASAERAAGGDDAAAVATTLTASTRTIQYSPASGNDGSPVRTDRGSIAELLAAATVANATVGDRSLGPDEQYVAAVRNETRATLAAVDGASVVQVRTRWTPLPGADVRSGATIGPTPPPDADVHAATVSVPLGTARNSGATAERWDEAVGRDGAGTENRSRATTDRSRATPTDRPSATTDRSRATPTDRPSATTDRSVEEAASGGSPAGSAPNRTLVEAAQTGGCSGLATTIARRVVGHVFPPEPVHAALHGDAESRERTVTRYETFARAVGADLDDVPLADGPRSANAALVEALADAFEPVACDGYRDPEAAAREAAPDEVTLVIRTWSQ